MRLPGFELFKDPPKSARPMVRWWWTGTDVEREELLEEVRELDEAGFLGAEIQAFMLGSPLNLDKTDPARHRRSHRFMQPHYYDALKAVLDEGAKRDLLFDLTACSAWPAGGVHVTKEDSMKSLLLGVKVLRGKQRYVGRVPRFRKPPLYRIEGIIRFVGLSDHLMTFYPDDMRLVRVVAARPIGRPGKARGFRPKTTYLDIESAVNLTDRVSEAGILDWDVPEGAWQVFALYAGPSGVQPPFDSREHPDGESLVLDHLAREPIEKHLERHLGQAKTYFGEHFGRTLRAFFTDSLELASDWIWTDGFLKEFRERRGYDLAPYLPVAYVPARDNKYLALLVHDKRPCFDFEGDLGERIRHDFEQTISDLFTERFVQAMTDWADANGLQSRIQAYGVRADALKAYGIAHIPETEQLYAGGMLDFLKLAGSAGVIHDKPIVTAESMVWNQRDYLTTPLKWKVAADRLFIAGINQMIYHGFPYQNPDFPYPGFDPFSSPYPFLTILCFASNFSRANPFWEFFTTMNTYVTRCQYVLQQGRTVCNVGLFCPLLNYPDAVLKREELVGGYLDEQDTPLPGHTFGGTLKKKLNQEERWAQAQIKVGDHLLANGYNYVHVDPESLLRARVESGQLAIGAAKLEVLVLPQVDRITIEVARKLQEVAEAGVPVVFVGQVPDRQPGFHNYRENDALVAQTATGLVERYDNVVETNADLAAHLTGRLGVMPGLTFEEPQPTIQYIHKHADGLDFYFIRHSSREPHTVSVHFPHPDRVPHLLDPWTGQVTTAAQYEATGRAIRVDLVFQAYGSCLVAFCPPDSSETAPHVLRSDLPVTRENGAIVAYATEAGEYVFQLSDGSRRPLRVEQDAPPAIRLDSWRLETALRDHGGCITPLHLDLGRLADWRDIPKLRHCSSKGIYSTCVNVDERCLEEGVTMTLDLGRVHDAAVVEVNGKMLQPLLVHPFSADVTPYLTTGQNELRITVTPTLYNRLIGYGKTGGRNWRQFRGRRKLSPSGLIGMVRLVPRRRLRVWPP